MLLSRAARANIVAESNKGTSGKYMSEMAIVGQASFGRRTVLNVSTSRCKVAGVDLRRGDESPTGTSAELQECTTQLAV